MSVGILQRALKCFKHLILIKILQTGAKSFLLYAKYGRSGISILSTDLNISLEIEIYIYIEIKSVF